VFCLADFPHRGVVMDTLKSLPDDENKDIIVWLVLHIALSADVCAATSSMSLPQFSADVYIMRVRLKK